MAAARQARQTAGQTDHTGCFVLGWLYYKGLVVDKNLPQTWAYVAYAEESMEDPEIGDEGELLPLWERQLSINEMKKVEVLRKALLDSWG